MNYVKLKKNKHLLDRHYFQDVFTKDECHNIINFTDTSLQGSYTEYGQQDNFSNTIKSKYINRTSGTEWVWGRITKYVWQVNGDFFNFNLNCIDDLQIMEYRKNSLFQWHIDINGVEHFTSRKLSVVVFLTERNDFKGGQLLFEFNENEKEAIEMRQGSMLVFPSFQVHKVTPVIEGIRHTLVAWAHGTPFC